MLRRIPASEARWNEFLQINDENVIQELWTSNRAVYFRQSQEAVTYEAIFDQLVDNQNFSYNDINQNLGYLRNRHAKLELTQLRPISIFLKHYNFSFYSHRANPGLTDTNFCRTHNNENGTFTYDYADIFTGPGNSGDLHVHTSHPFLMDANINWVFTQFYFIPAFNALIVKLQRLELSRKSGFVLNEIERRAHEFVLNHSLRYRSDSPRDHDLVTAERLYNKNSAFLDLHHSLPFQRDLFYFNSIRTFARRFRSGNSCLLRNEKRSDFPTGAGIEIEKKANPQNKLNPLSLADQCALQLRKHVAAEFCKAFPCEADFQHSRFTKTIQKGFANFLKH